MQGDTPARVKPGAFFRFLDSTLGPGLSMLDS